MVRYLIVNADDFGASRGINRGILDAHRHGIVTSTSLMVTTPWSEEAAVLARQAPELDIGLHVDLSGTTLECGTGLFNGEHCDAELRHQVQRFHALVGRAPTHVDSHHNAHRDARLLPSFLKIAHRHRLPLREHSPARYCSKFYGQWGGETHLEQIGVRGFARLLDGEVGEGITELGCHPGYIDPELRSGYVIEREAELRTLCDPDLPTLLAARRIRLIHFGDLDALARSAGTSDP
ncbi:MAG TPA: ChbG/HpnK family deacetylase [Gemmatimonadaceae bacterium]